MIAVMHHDLLRIVHYTVVTILSQHKLIRIHPYLAHSISVVSTGCVAAT